MNKRSRATRWGRLVGFFIAAGAVLLLSGCGRIAAIIQGFSPSPQGTLYQVETGKPVEIKATVANTGSKKYPFIVTAQVYDAGNNLVKKFSTTLDPALPPGEARTVTWTFIPPKKGLYSLKFTVYKDEDTPLAEMPQLPQAAIVATEATPQPETTAGRFKKGERVRVTENLNVRQGPSISQPEVRDPHYPGYMPAGSLGNIEDGPVQADGYTWWKVKFDRDVTGWCVEDGLKSLAELLGKKK